MLKSALSALIGLRGSKRASSGWQGQNARRTSGAQVAFKGYAIRGAASPSWLMSIGSIRGKFERPRAMGGKKITKMRNQRGGKIKLIKCHK